MRKCYGFYDNGKYRVGCNSATVYVYNQENVELAKFRDIPYAYTGAFRPGTNLFVAKSTEGKLAIYDLDAGKLLKKISIASHSGQDEGYAFSHSGDLFYNIEKPRDSLYTQLAVYDTSDFSKKAVYFAGNRRMHLEELEVYPDEIYVVGFMRDDDGVLDYGFAAKYADGEIIAPRRIQSKAYVLPNHRGKRDETDYGYLQQYKFWERQGFTEKGCPFIFPERTPPGRPHVTIKQIYEANA